MAGIGFVLRRLVKKDDYLGVVQAFYHSAMVSAGPWMLTVLSLSTLYYFGTFLPDRDSVVLFRDIIVYNFSFSLVLSAPFFMVTTRAVADLVYEKTVDQVPGLVVASFSLIYVCTLPVVIFLYFFFADLDFAQALYASVNFFLTETIWMLLLYLGAIKNYKTISFSFIVSVIIIVLGTLYLGFKFKLEGMLVGFNLGLTLIAFLLLGNILADFPYRFVWPQWYLGKFKRYYKLGLAGLLYNAGVWVDKWIMWSAPESEVDTSGLHTFSLYDFTMFLAYLSIIPSFALFIFSVETNFFESYNKMYKKILSNTPFKSIEATSKELFSRILENGRNILILQGTVTLVLLLTAAQIFAYLGVNFLQLGIFRLGLLGSAFNAFTLFILIILYYFDHRNAALLITSTMFITNLSFTFVSKAMGFLYYGYGFFLAMALSFLVASFVLAFKMRRLLSNIFLQPES